MQNDPTPNAFDRLLPLTEVAKRVGVSQATIYRYVARGVFPRPVRAVAQGAVRWPESVIHEWIKDRIAEANAKAAS